MNDTHLSGAFHFCVIAVSPLCLCNSLSLSLFLSLSLLLSVFSGALQIEMSEESDQGKYECVATNSDGTRYSTPANLYVRGKRGMKPNLSFEHHSPLSMLRFQRTF